MTRDEAREFAKVVQAYADGMVVQRFQGAWLDEGDNANLYSWVPHRIKPEPSEWWVVPGLSHAAQSKDEAEALADSMDWPTSSIVHVREVTP